jgi:hypothetical protein
VNETDDWRQVVGHGLAGSLGSPALPPRRKAATAADGGKPGEAVGPLTSRSAAHGWLQAGLRRGSEPFRPTMCLCDDRSRAL